MRNYTGVVAVSGGGGVAPPPIVVPGVWSYQFLTFGPPDYGGVAGTDTIAGSSDSPPIPHIDNSGSNQYAGAKTDTTFFPIINGASVYGVYITPISFQPSPTVDNPSPAVRPYLQPAPSPGRIFAAPIIYPVNVSAIDWIIPAGVRRITLLGFRVSVAGNTLVRLGTNLGVLTSGYESVNTTSGATAGAGAGSPSTLGLQVPDAGSSNSFHMVFYKVDPNRWICIAQSSFLTQYVVSTISSIQLLGELTTLRYVSPQTLTGSFQLTWEF